MGIKENFKKIIDYQKHKNLENKYRRNIIKQSIQESTFYEDYSSFIIGLKNKLDTYLTKEGNREITFKPNRLENAKYFEEVMRDTRFNIDYIIKRTSGGEYTFRQKTIKDIEEELKKKNKTDK